MIRPTTSPMGLLQTVFYLALLLALFAAYIAFCLAVCARQLAGVWRAGHPVIAMLTGAVLVAVALFLVVGTWATIRAAFHV